MALTANDFRPRIPSMRRTVVEDPSVARGLPDAIGVTIGCLLIVVGLWGLFGIHNGFGTETLLIYFSDRRPGFEGFLYPDPSRPFTSLFYHLSYVLGSTFGAPGSFVPYQLVYGVLWMLRGLLSYVIVLRLTPGRPALAMFAGLFAVLHTADGALNWVGQLNQFGFIFLMLLSFLLLLLAFDARRPAIAALAAFGSAGAGYLSIWSYESPLPVMIAFPVAAAILRRDVRLSRLTWVSAIYLIPLIVFVDENIVPYLSGGGAGSYQMAVSRHDYSWAALVDDLGLHLKNSIAFWNWPELDLPLGEPAKLRHRNHSGDDRSWAGNDPRCGCRKSISQSFSIGLAGCCIRFFSVWPFDRVLSGCPRSRRESSVVADRVSSWFCSCVSYGGVTLFVTALHSG